MKKYFLCAIGLVAFNMSVYANTPTPTDTPENTSFLNQISFQEDGTFQTQEGIKGRIVCEKQKIKELLTQSSENRVEIAKCISVESFDITQNVDGNSVQFIFDGAFNYPRFTKKTTIQVIDNSNAISDMYTLASKSNLNEQQAKDLERYIFKTVKITFHEDNNTVTFEILNDQNNLISETTIQAKNISGLIESGYKLSQTQQPTDLINHLKNIEITKMVGYTPQQKKDSEFSGSINLLLAQITNDTFLSLYNFNEKNVVNFKAIDGGVKTDILYPVSETKLLSFDLMIKMETLKQIQEQLLQADNVNDYMGIFMSLSMGMIDPTPQEIIIRDFALTDLNGVNILEAKELTLNPQTRGINGEIRFINSPSDYIVAQLNGDTVSLIDTQGQTQQLSLDQFATKTEEFWKTPRATEFKNAFFSEIDKLKQTEPKTSVTHFYEGLIVGIETAQSRYQANEVIDMANKLATLAHANNQTLLAKSGQPANIADLTLEKTGLTTNTTGNNLPNGGSLEINAINDSSVIMTITFPSPEICEAGARILSQPTDCNGAVLPDVEFFQY